VISHGSTIEEHITLRHIILHKNCKSIIFRIIDHGKNNSRKPSRKSAPYNAYVVPVVSPSAKLRLLAIKTRPVSSGHTIHLNRIIVRQGCNGIPFMSLYEHVTLEFDAIFVTLNIQLVLSIDLLTSFFFLGSWTLALSLCKNGLATIYSLILRNDVSRLGQYPVDIVLQYTLAMPGRHGVEYEDCDRIHDSIMRLASSFSDMLIWTSPNNLVLFHAIKLSIAPDSFMLGATIIHDEDVPPAKHSMHMAVLTRDIHETTIPLCKAIVWLGVAGK